MVLDSRLIASFPRLRSGTRRLGAAIMLTATAACTYRVDSFVDSPDANPGDFECARALSSGNEGIGEAGGLCTLRAAVMEANASFLGRDRIEAPAGTYLLVLPPAAGGGSLKITEDVDIQGSGAEVTIVEQTHGDSVLFIDGGDTRIGQLTITGGGAVQAGGGLYIRDAEVELADAVIRENFGVTTGGGGMYVAPDATVRIYRTAVQNNNAIGAFGGGIWNQGELFVFDSTVSGNDSNRAGGIRNEGLLNLRNVTVSGNTAHSDEAGTGGISQIGFAFLNNVTVTGNTGIGADPASFLGGGIASNPDATTVIKNSIIAGNDGSGGPNDCSGSFTSDSRYNLIGDTNGCELPALTTTWILNTEPELLGLSDNGGPTRTHFPLANSPARDAGFPFTPGGPAADACQGTDQRGVPRPQGAGGCDLGAYEVTLTGSEITGFMIVNADSNIDLRPLLDGDQLVLEELPANLSIRALVGITPGSVRFGFDDQPAQQTENFPPYALAGDNQGDFNPAPFAFIAGEHELTATPFAEAGAAGAAGIARTIRFKVVEQSP